MRRGSAGIAAVRIESRECDDGGASGAVALPCAGKGRGFDSRRRHHSRPPGRAGYGIAGGQGRIKGEIIRLGHLGFYDETDMHTMIAALDGTLVDLGMNERPGAGTQALIESFKR